MAFTIDPTQDEQDKQQQNSQALADPSQQAQSPQVSSAAPGAGGSAATSGVSSSASESAPVKELSSGGSSSNPFGGAPGSGGQGGSSGSSKGTSSGSYTNLQDYLKANQGGDFGGQVAGRLNSDISGAGQAIQSADQGFQQQVKGGTTDYNADLVNSAISDPTALSADQTSALQGQLHAQYAGPNNISDQSDLYNPAQSALSTAQQNAQATNSDTGRWALLNQYFGGQGQQYNQGQQALDSALLAADPNAQSGFQQAQQATQGLGTQWNQLQANDAAMAQQAAQTNANTASQSNAALGGEVNKELTGYQTALTADQAAQQKAVADIQNGLSAIGKTAPANSAGSILTPNTTPGAIGFSGGGVAGGSGVNSATQALLTKYGITAGIPTNDTGYQESSADTGFWGVDPSKYFQASATPTMSSVTNAQQQAKLNALQGILGQSKTNFDPNQTGTYDPNNPGSFDQSGYQQAVSTSQAAYNQQASTLLNQIKNAAAAAPSTMQSNIPGLENSIQQYFDQLNAARNAAGLGSLVDPYSNLAGEPIRSFTPQPASTPGGGTASHRGGL